MKQAPQQIIYELCIMSPPTVKSDGSQPIEPRKRPGEGSRQVGITMVIELELRGVTATAVGL